MSPVSMPAAAVSAVVAARSSTSGESQAGKAVLAISLCPAIALIFVLARVYTRVMLIRKWFVEDTVILLATASSIGMSVFMGLSCYYGFGRHQVNVSAAEQMEQNKVGIGGIQLYLWTHCFLKLSILLQYLRISIMPLERRLCYAIIGVLAAESLALSVTHLHLCAPFAALYTAGLPGASCLNRTAVYFAQLSITIAMDFLILIAPLFILRHLRLRFWRQRVLLSIVLAFGGFACVVSVLRLQTIIASTTSKDSTWDKVPSAFYGVIEPNLGIVCACLVTLRPLIVRIVPGAGRWLNGQTPPDPAANGTGPRLEGGVVRPTFWSRMCADSLWLSTVRHSGSAASTKAVSPSSEYTELAT